ncbi:MAG: PAS domain-containing protein [Planctomycetota bacterium]|jgi:PAS domain S-box-containing protein
MRPIDMYRSIFENAVEGIFQTTAEGRYLNANPALARLYGYESPEELMEGLTDIAGQLYVDVRRRADFAEAMQTQGSVHGFESQIRRKDGEMIWISENVRSVLDRDGTLLYYEGFVSDISDRRRLREELILEKARLEKEIEGLRSERTEVCN